LPVRTLTFVKHTVKPAHCKAPSIQALAQWLTGRYSAVPLPWVRVW
jgi:hypothetical protein